MRRDPLTAERMVAVLRDFGFDAPELTPQLFLDPDRLVRLGEPPLRLGLPTSVSGLEFDEAHRRAIHADLGGVRITIVSLEDLRTNKRAAGRTRELADLEELPDTP